MDLFVIRHAIAVPRGSGYDDDARPLTEVGRERFALAVRGVDALGLRFDAVHHSPWVRAVETARMLAPVTDGALRSTDALARAPDRQTLALAAQGDRVALVGHEPWTSELVAWLLTGDRDHLGAFPLKKGGVVWLRGDAEPGEMGLKAALPPKVLRAVGSFLTEPVRT